MWSNFTATSSKWAKAFWRNSSKLALAMAAPSSSSTSSSSSSASSSDSASSSSVSAASAASSAMAFKAASSSSGSMMASTTSSTRISSSRTRCIKPKISSIVLGQALMASTMLRSARSIFLAMMISSSRVNKSTWPISRMYMRTGSVVRPNSESTLDKAASASATASSSVTPVAPSFINKESASGASSDTCMPKPEIMLTMFSIWSVSDTSSGKWSLISAYVM